MPLDDNHQNHIPEAVRRASARADELARAAGVVNTPEDPADEEASPAADDQPEETTTVVDAPADPAPAPAPPADGGWEQRYRTLQGKYDNEIGQLRGQVRSLESLLSNLQQAPAVPPTPPAAAADQPLVIPKEHVEAFGDDLINAAQLWAEAKLSPRIAKLEAEIERLRSGHTEIQQQTAQDRVMSSLDADPELGGNWRTINENPEFITWLNQVDPFVGQPRMRLLSEAFGRGDSVRTANFFKAFITEHTAVQPDPAPPVHTPQPEADRVSLETLAAPGRPAGSVANSGASTEKRMWTSTQISAFYRDCADGKYAAREAEKLRIEQDIFSAAAEGRVR